ncbi:MAG: double-strand break repair protein AddB, partial [Alphaproteobacteria bacterium]|nr:double-strand break repair protein AddB [Alphaproteobacteria bacterium]
PIQGGAAFRAGFDALDRPAPPWPTIRPAVPPAPRPPVPTRPRQLSVTEIETWMRDPYSIYARHILDLHPLDPLDADAGAAERGQIIHRAFDMFVKKYPAELPADAFDRLAQAGASAFRALIDRPGVAAFWWPRFLRIAEWLIAEERRRRAGLAQIISEVKGKTTLPGPAGEFTLTAKADRVERDRLGQLTIVDYKTGRLPRPGDTVSGLSPQLPLEAVIARSGGFSGVAHGPIVGLEFWRLSGGEPAGEVANLAKADRPLEALIAEARSGLLRLIATFDDPHTPYLAQPNPEHAPVHIDYAHLARVKEWAGEGIEP